MATKFTIPISNLYSNSSKRVLKVKAWKLMIDLKDIVSPDIFIPVRDNVGEKIEYNSSAVFHLKGK